MAKLKAHKLKSAAEAISLVLKRVLRSDCSFDIEFPVEFPEDYQAENLAGKTATFKATLHELKAKEVPALDDDFAQDVGEDDVAALKAKVTEELRGHKEKQAKDQERQLTLKALVDANPSKLPHL